MKLDATLAARLGALADLVSRDDMRELIVASPTRISLLTAEGTRAVSVGAQENGLRQLAFRFWRDLPAPEEGSVDQTRSGEISEALWIRIDGHPRGRLFPVIRIVRLERPEQELDNIVLSPELKFDLLQSLRSRQSLAVFGIAVGSATDLMSTLAVTLAGQYRLLWLSPEHAPPRAPPGVARALPSSAGLAYAESIQADLIIALRPAPNVWADLVDQSRPFLVSITAPSIEDALDRMVARYLAARSAASRAAAVAMVSSRVGLLGRLEDSDGHADSAMLTQLIRLARDDHELSVRPHAAQRLSTLGSHLAQRVPLPVGRAQSTVSELRAEHLLSDSFVSEIDGGSDSLLADFEEGFGTASEVFDTVLPPPLDVETQAPTEDAVDPLVDDTDDPVWDQPEESGRDLTAPMEHALTPSEPAQVVPRSTSDVEATVPAPEGLAPRLSSDDLFPVAVSDLDQIEGDDSGDVGSID